MQRYLLANRWGEEGYISSLAASTARWLGICMRVCWFAWYGVRVDGGFFFWLIHLLFVSQKGCRTLIKLRYNTDWVVKYTLQVVFIFVGYFTLFVHFSLVLNELSSWLAGLVWLLACHMFWTKDHRITTFYIYIYKHSKTHTFIHTTACKYLLWLNAKMLLLRCVEAWDTFCFALGYFFYFYTHRGRTHTQTHK